MSDLRKRVPFKFSSEEDVVEILDDQEQDEVIQTLRVANIASNRLYLLALQATLALSGFLHILYLWDPIKTSPLLALFPSTKHDPPVPLVNIFSLLSVSVHISLAFFVHPNLIPGINISHPLNQIPLAISMAAPVLCVLLGRTWQTTVWWSITPSVALLVQSILRWIEEGNKSILELEKKKYVVRGA